MVRSLNVKSTCYSKSHLTAHLARLRETAGFIASSSLRGRVTRTTQFLSRLSPSDQSVPCEEEGGGVGGRTEEGGGGSSTLM
ncbi:hypothetical protein PBY51_022402 [Eleginops maclovinus]|uniref:Uncharacterized protein n=1 Tax=Eleginops maclovinus TaxID=56733 RepID=A0AAN8ALV4_ELEMC|nr:hypothetical protein PBY51_022402 [Eleginops maclovinus]